MRREEERHSAFGVQRGEWFEQWRFGQALRRIHVGRRLLRWWLRLPLSSAYAPSVYLTLLDATLARHPTSVDFKGLSDILSYLESPLTRNTGRDWDIGSLSEPYEQAVETTCGVPVLLTAV